MLKVFEFEFEFSRDLSYSKLVLILRKNNIIEWNTFNSRYRYLFSFNQRKKERKKKKKKNLIFLAIFIIRYIIFHEQKRVCVCVQPEPTISFYVDIRHAMFSYVINEGNSSRCLNEAMEKKRKKKERKGRNSRERDTLGKSEVSLKRQLLSSCWKKLEEE